jgi:hypothetical protein
MNYILERKLMRYLAQTLITLAMLALSTHSYAQCGIPTPDWCDADSSGVVDATDIELISDAKGTASTGPEDPMDVDTDGQITVLDARQCVDYCDSPTQCTDALNLCTGTEIQPDRLFLQQLGPDSVIIKWRGNSEGGAEAEKVCFSTDENDLQLESKTWATTTATGHREVLLEGLTPDTTYYYSVGGAGVADISRHFRTAPAVGNLPPDGNTRIWIVGDSGVAGVPSGGGSQYKDGAGLVRDGFNTWMVANGGEHADLFLMLGDNAYAQGTDLEHQLAIFDVYPDILTRTPLWPTIGNHEAGFGGLGNNPDPNAYDVFGNSMGGPDPAPDSPMPYLNIFTLPTSGEIGGAMSSTEQYYSFDYANVHIVSLDSQLAMRDPTSQLAMKMWLEADLAVNTQDWTIVIFHHPPYTKGSHDSDTTGLGADEMTGLEGIDQPIWDIRAEFIPVFEANGVDLAYSGHSHIYERSYYLNGHYGLSGDFDELTMAELNQANTAPGTGKDPGTTDDNPPYTQTAKNGFDDKVVYTVAGNGGKATNTSPGYPHPAHFSSELIIGSVVIDLNETSLTARFINEIGGVVDHFTMTRSP